MKPNLEDFLWWAIVGIIVVAVGVFLGLAAFSAWGPDTVHAVSLIQA